MEQREKKCRFCDMDLYAKVQQYARPVLAPLTLGEEIEFELVEKTGWAYVPVSNLYCPMCGRRLKHCA